MAKRDAATDMPEVPSVADFDPAEHADLPPAYDPTHIPDAPTLAPREGETREAMLLRVIARLPMSCSFDMSNGEIFGRCLERLKTHQLTDEELAWALPYIRKSTDAHTQKRDRAAAAREAARQGRPVKSIEEQLDA